MSSLLAFDTSTEKLSVGLWAGGQAWLHEAPGGMHSGAALIPAIQSLLARAGLALREIDAIAFGQGPGAFTGLRTACAVAQGLAYGAGKPVLPLDTLAVVAHDAALAWHGASSQAHAQDRIDTIWIAMDARMQEIYGACYEREGDGWRAVAPPALWTLDAFNAAHARHPAPCLAGSAMAAFGERLDTAGASHLVPQAWPSAQALLCEARLQWHAGRAVDAADAVPVYLRDKVALTTAEREAAKAVRA